MCVYNCIIAFVCSATPLTQSSAELHSRDTKDILKPNDPTVSLQSGTDNMAHREIRVRRKVFK